MLSKVFKSYLSAELLFSEKIVQENVTYLTLKIVVIDSCPLKVAIKLREH